MARDEVTAFQLGYSTVVTIPKGMGIRPGQKLKIKKTKKGATLEKSETLLEIMENASSDSFWTDHDFNDYQRRRKLGIEAIKKMKKIW